MLLESRISDKIVILIDAESVGGVDKSQLSTSADPDHIFQNTVALVRTTIENLGAALSVEGKPAPVMMEAKFGVRVDSNAIVSIARTPAEGQFQLHVRWDA